MEEKPALVEINANIAELTELLNTAQTQVNELKQTLEKIGEFQIRLITD